MCCLSGDHQHQNPGSNIFCLVMLCCCCCLEHAFGQRFAFKDGCLEYYKAQVKVHSFGMIWIRVNDPRSLESWYISKQTDSSVPLMHHDPSDCGLLILCPNHPKEMNTRCLQIDPFTTVCLVTWPLNGSEAGGDFVLIY